MAGSINHLNNDLPLFPKGNDTSKFTEVEITGLLEWSLPTPWEQEPSKIWIATF
jgi:hypothetical protein